MSIDRVVVVKKKTDLEELLKRHGTLSQVQFYLESRGKSFGDYSKADRTYQAGFQATLESIPTAIVYAVVEKELLDTYQFSEKDLILVLGDPGLFVNVAKYSNGRPMLVVNPDESLDNNFATCVPANCRKNIADFLAGKMDLEKITMAEVRLEDGQTMLAVNDLYIGKSNRVSAKYTIDHSGQIENQSSDGVVVSTGAGSTGWRTSIFAGAYALIGENLPIDSIAFPRDSDHLEFAVMNPFPSRKTKTSIINGVVNKDNPLKISSMMPEDGVIFSDGIISDYIEFAAGKTAVIKPSEVQAYLVKR